MISLAPLADRVYAVLGLGRSGLATCEALAAAGKTVWAWDDEPATRAAAAEAGMPIVEPGQWDLSAVEALVLSPGIPRHFPTPHAIVRRADAAGVPVIGDMELFARAVPDATCVGVTGTNGKSTTTALIGHILDAAGVATVAGGNLGPPVLGFEPLSAAGVYVFEISSYQLDITQSLPLRVAVLLNIAADHLDRHGGFDGYVAAKRRIFGLLVAGGTAIVGVDDPVCLEIYESLAAGAEGPRAVPISATRPLPSGVSVENGRLIDRLGGTASGFAFDLARAPALPGVHNAQNAAAAYAACRTLDLAAADIATGFETFPGLAHRQERVAVIDGIAFVNDSKATNPDAAARALACYEPIYWIVGGRAKDGGFDAVAPYLARVRHAFVIGEAAETIAGFLDRQGVARTLCEDLETAVWTAWRLAGADGEPGAVVLLSPMCASFDQFANFEQRGEAFRGAVRAMAV